jgi:putative mRNA 3-end processing factor
MLTPSGTRWGWLFCAGQNAKLAFMNAPVLTFTDQGIYCPAGDFHIDPWRPVARALITHGHSDHARLGHDAYLATNAALPVIRHRLGPIVAEGIDYGRTRRIGDATVSFHPAGHVPGSAQIRVEVAGEVWVVSGDYKTEADGLAEPFEPVRCHSFITECTFGLPVFNWVPQPQVMTDIASWWAANAAAGKISILGAYSFGKAQRLMAGLPPVGPILTHGAVEEVTAILRGQGYVLPETIRVTRDVTGKSHPGALVIAPPSALGSVWAGRFAPSEEAFASGWMAVRGIRRRRGLGQGFALSDHADWAGLNAAIRATGATRVFATHGYTVPFRRWLESQGYEAGIVATDYAGDDATEGVEMAAVVAAAPGLTE